MVQSEALSVSRQSVGGHPVASQSEATQSPVSRRRCQLPRKRNGPVPAKKFTACCAPLCLLALLPALAEGEVSTGPISSAGVYYTEYMHIPKAGTFAQKVCAAGTYRGKGKGSMRCLPRTELLNRKCGLIGEHCDWTAKLRCLRRHDVRRPVKFWTVLRDPVERVRSEFAYFGTTRGDCMGKLWTSKMCAAKHNLTEWILAPDNSAHNRMARMLHGRPAQGNACKITASAEFAAFGKLLSGRYRLPTKGKSAMAAELNEAEVVAHEAVKNLRNHFFAWGVTSEAPHFFCVLRQALPGQLKRMDIELLFMSKKSHPGERKEEYEGSGKEVNDRLIREHNKLDMHVYEYAKAQWERWKAHYAGECAQYAKGSRNVPPGASPLSSDVA